MTGPDGVPVTVTMTTTGTQPPGGCGDGCPRCRLDAGRFATITRTGRFSWQVTAVCDGMEILHRPVTFTQRGALRAARRILTRAARLRAWEQHQKVITP